MNLLRWYPLVAVVVVMRYARALGSKVGALTVICKKTTSSHEFGPGDIHTLTSSIASQSAPNGGTESQFGKSSVVVLHVQA